MVPTVTQSLMARMLCFLTAMNVTCTCHLSNNLIDYFKWNTALQFWLFFVVAVVFVLCSGFGFCFCFFFFTVRALPPYDI